MENEKAISATGNVEAQDINNGDGNQHKWCFAWPDDTRQARPGTAQRGALLKKAKWDQGGTIIISFLDGVPKIHEKVKRAAQKWVAPGLANLTLDFRNTTTIETDIRISFRFSGSWSMVGTTCRNNKDLSKPTMNYGWLDTNSTDEDVERVVLHEFGHALGLTHEHMNPAGGIQWNRKQVIADLSAPPNKWKIEVIENNMFRTFEKRETNFTQLDENSIMMYPIPAKWTKDGFTVDLNSRLSEVDKQFIREQYP